MSPPLERELLALKLVEPNLGQPEARVVLASGVPSAAVTVLPAPADGTIEEAKRVRTFLRADGARSIVVITSKFASRRACFIFRRVMEANVRVACAASPLDPFEPAVWWQHPRDALYVLLEYEKFAANAVTLLAG